MVELWLGWGFDKNGMREIEADRRNSNAAAPFDILASGSQYLAIVAMMPNADKAKAGSCIISRETKDCLVRVKERASYFI